MLRHTASKARSSLLFAIAVLLAASRAHAQIGAAQGDPAAHAIAIAAALPPYDVVSIKENHTGDGMFNMTTGENRFKATNVPLRVIVEFAYGVKEDLISGLPGPLASVHYDIEAKAFPADDGTPRNLTDEQLGAMIIKLLADRFQLQYHLQLKALPVYDLLVSRGGPKFTLSQAEIKDSSGNINHSDRSFILTAKGATTANLADYLSDEVHRKVIDKTGLKGSTDISLKWTDDAAAPEENSLSIFTAVQEQLGLKLQPSKGPVETLVVDHIEAPSEN